MAAGPGPRLCFQLRTGERSLRNRFHFDIAAVDPVAEVSRLLALGATVVRETDDYTVFNDPEGNNFGVVREPS